MWAMVRPFLHAKMAKRLRLLGKDRAALHAVVPPAVLPPEFGGTSTDTFHWLLDEMEELEKSCGVIGGFSVPMCVDDPTGAKRKAAAAAAVADEARAGDAREHTHAIE